MVIAAKKTDSAIGFTLIEIAIVLVIIGLIVGGVLVGRDLITAATTRAQISQIEKYQTAVNTFKLKYGYLPGDIPDPTAQSFGFLARGAYAGQGDGNGMLQSNYDGSAGQNYGHNEYGGETTTFWVDLSAANLIDGGFSATSPTANGAFAASPITGVALARWFPIAKVGNENYVYVWSYSRTNYFGVSAITQVENGGNGGGVDSNTTIPVLVAYNIDAKIDDGMPLTGNVLAAYLNLGNNHEHFPGASNGFPDLFTFQIFRSSSTCFDTNGAWTTIGNYSIRANGGAGENCVLSFKLK